LIRATFPEDAARAVAIAQGEGFPNPRAYNPEKHYDRQGNYICSGSFGIMQIACVHNLEDPSALFDVEFNLKVANRIYKSSGWQPWGAYTNGSYKKFLAMNL
jgi:hypothetical protein